MPKLKNSIETFWVIFKQCALIENSTNFQNLKIIFFFIIILLLSDDPDKPQIGHCKFQNDEIIIPTQQPTKHRPRMIRKSRLVKVTFGCCAVIFLILQFFDHSTEPKDAPVAASNLEVVTQQPLASSEVNTHQVKPVNLNLSSPSASPPLVPSKSSSSSSSASAPLLALTCVSSCLALCPAILITAASPWTTRRRILTQLQQLSKSVILIILYLGLQCSHTCGLMLKTGSWFSPSTSGPAALSTAPTTPTGPSALTTCMSRRSAMTTSLYT